MRSDAGRDMAGDSAWTIEFDHYDPGDETRREVILALGNGVFVTRGAVTDSGQDDRHYPGTYHAGCYDRVPNQVAGERDITESLVNLPNWLPLVFRPAAGAWWRLDELGILEYRQRLDMRGGRTVREVLAQDRDGRRLRIEEERLVSMDDPRLCALRLRLQPVNWTGQAELKATLDARVINANVRRFEDYEKRHLRVLGAELAGPGVALLSVQTSDRRATVACAQRLHAGGAGDGGNEMAGCANEGQCGHVLRLALREGECASVEKLVALCSSLDPRHADPSAAALEAVAGAPDFDTLQERHARAWERMWADVAIEADRADVLRALRFHAFHILQTVSPHTAALDAGIPARGWHGEAYHGHVFWDELFVLPFLNFRFPAIARASLMYRHRRLGAAREAARAAGLRGAMYPWRSASEGVEVTPRHQKNLLNGEWMRDHTWRQRHIGSAIAFSTWHYWLTTGDDAFMQDCGAEMMLEIARFWASIAEPAGDRYVIRGVIGPDEYHNAYPWREEAGLDNNACTNLMAVWTLCRARELLGMLPAEQAASLRRRLALDDEELALWDRISRRMTVCFHEDGVISQFEGFERLEPFDPDCLPPHLAGERTDWALRALGRNPDEFQVTKQADVLALFYLLGEDEVTGMLRRLGYAFGREDILRTARYYLPRTVHRSSLSRVVYCGALARLDPAQSWDFWLHALETDLNPLKGESVQEGVHLGAMGSTIDILQRRYLGISATPQGLRIDPAPPPGLGRVSLGLRYRGLRLQAETRDGCLAITADGGNAGPLHLLRGEERIALSPGECVEMPLPH
ncbi:hypothetical protein NCCP691_01490 [Noviherbaspirillum aridicola]|uniref:Trehalose 6-phosphate phosphorylase n=2 Tax=Noviherbaspirillum aridicola TaxID=2849687 RepID=A0ABQ4PZ84_9BURK|nr:hypothetical protein NCCP691_01490 [Noviherbaspirillum aridicola]